MSRIPHQTAEFPPTTALRLANAHAHVVTFYQSIQEGGKRSVQLELALSDLFEVYKATGMSG